MTDPRAANCRADEVKNGLITGVELEYVEVPQAKYQLVSVELIGEDVQGPGGPTSLWFHVLNADNTPNFSISSKVMLSWPWPTLQEKLSPGTPGEHMISGLPYNPPNVGPGEIHIEDENGQLISDRIGGIGLPYRHHVSFQLTFKERGEVVTPPDGGDTDNVGDLATVLEQQARILEMLDRIMDKVESIGSHFVQQ